MNLDFDPEGIKAIHQQQGLMAEIIFMVSIGHIRQMVARTSAYINQLKQNRQ